MRGDRSGFYVKTNRRQPKETRAHHRGLRGVQRAKEGKDSRINGVREEKKRLGGKKPAGGGRERQAEGMTQKNQIKRGRLKEGKMVPLIASEKKIQGMAPKRVEKKIHGKSWRGTATHKDKLGLNRYNLTNESKKNKGLWKKRKICCGVSAGERPRLGTRIKKNHRDSLSDEKKKRGIRLPCVTGRGRE